ncbi:hypothetical protein HYS31_05500 [Candidatus Woesearchaeota archaeon]|nr:hypothetical protein [Candidatus Woesearchaeota archaeon]
MDKEFEEKCLLTRNVTLEPTVTEVKDERSKQFLAEQHKGNSEYFLECAKNLLRSTTPLAAVLIGHFAMEHKGNQLLALHGYKVESHICTQIGLSRIVGRKDLAKKLSDIFTLRQSVGYRLTLERSDESRIEAEKIMNETVIPFFEEVEKLVDKVNQ